MGRSNVVGRAWRVQRALNPRLSLTAMETAWWPLIHAERSLSPSLPAASLGAIRVRVRSALHDATSHVRQALVVGTPAALLLQRRDATVTIVHSRTPNPAEIVKRADIVIAACGRGLPLVNFSAQREPFLLLKPRSTPNISLKKFLRQAEKWNPKPTTLKVRGCKGLRLKTGR